MGVAFKLSAVCDGSGCGLCVCTYMSVEKLMRSIGTSLDREWGGRGWVLMNCLLLICVSTLFVITYSHLSLSLSLSLSLLSLSLTAIAIKESAHVGDKASKRLGKGVDDLGTLQTKQSLLPSLNASLPPSLPFYFHFSLTFSFNLYSLSSF